MSIARLRSLVLVSVLASLTSAVVSAGVVHFLGMTLSGDEQARLSWPTESFWYSPHDPSPTFEPWEEYTGASAGSIFVDPGSDTGQNFSAGSTIEVVVPPAPGPASAPFDVEPPSPIDGGNGGGGSNASDGGSTFSQGSIGNTVPPYGEEFCANGEDDNNNGTVDEQPCSPLYGSAKTEICGNGEDDNDNGVADENPPCSSEEAKLNGASVDSGIAAPVVPMPVDTATSVIDLVEQAINVVAEYFGVGVVPETQSTSFGGEGESDLSPPSDPIVLQQVVNVKNDVRTQLEKVIKMAPGVIGLFGKVMPIPPDALKAANELYVDWMNVTVKCSGPDEAECSAAIAGTSDTINQFESFLQRMLGMQTPEVRIWIETEAEKLEQSL